MKTQRPGGNTGLSKAGMILDRKETKKFTPVGWRASHSLRTQMDPATSRVL